MSTLSYIILANFLISLGSLIGVFTLSIKEAWLQKILLTLVSLSSGAMLGGAFLHLMPEGLEQSDPLVFFSIMLGTLIVYLLIEKLLHWRHCHKHGGECHAHAHFGVMNLVGDGVHNFIDGLVIAATFMVSIPLGISTAFAMAMHEIPQEIGDFGVLLYSGFTRKKALLANFLTALLAVIGGIVGWALSYRVEHFSSILLPIAAGGFLYIALSDLLPEIRKGQSMKVFLLNLSFIIGGMLIMLAAKLLGGE